MKKIITLFFFILSNFVSYGQCSTVSVQISSSDTTYVQLYQAGFFNIPSGFDNICEWEVTSFSGDVLHQETTSGGANDQSSVFFNHSIPLTDSMKATIIITNDTEGIICTMNDTLYWKETEVLPGSFVGNWDVLSSNGGVEEPITTSAEVILDAPNIEIIPSLVYNQFMIKGDLDYYSFTIVDLNGQILATHNNIQTQEEIDVSHLSAGLYFVQFWDKNKQNIIVKKMVKI